MLCCVFFFKQKTAYEMRIRDLMSDVCFSDLPGLGRPGFCVGEVLRAHLVELRLGNRADVLGPAGGRGSRRAAGNGGRGDEAKQEFLHGTDFPGIEVSVVRQRGSTTRQCRPASSSMQAIRLLTACAPIAAHSVPVRR